MPNLFSKEIQLLTAPAQEPHPPVVAFNELIQIYERLPQSTGVLFNIDGNAPDVTVFDGSNSSALLEQQDTWESLYASLQQAQITRDQRLDPWSALASGINHYLARDLVPIRIAHFAYDTLNPQGRDWLSDSLAQSVGLEPGDHPESHFENRTAFFASAYQTRRFVGFAPQDHLHYGLEVRFIPASEFIFTNIDGGFNNIALDVDNNEGFQEITLDREFPVRYMEPGRKQIKVRATLTNSDVLEASFSIVIVASDVPAHKTWNLSGESISYDGNSYPRATGTAYVFLRAGADPSDSVVNPLILADAWRSNLGSKQQVLEDMWKRLSDEGLTTSIRDAGFDLILVTYDDASNYIQSNAGVMVTCIRMTNSSGTKVVVGGASMGGLVARYAVMWMETFPNSEDPFVAMYFSLDSPHTLGAYVPWSTQCLLEDLETQGWTEGDATLTAVVNALRTPSAKQMLYLNVFDADPLSFEFNIRLGLEFDSMGTLPSKTDSNYALASGPGNASKPSNIIRSSEKIVWWDYEHPYWGRVAWLEMYSLSGVDYGWYGTGLLYSVSLPKKSNPDSWWDLLRRTSTLSLAIWGDYGSTPGSFNSPNPYELVHTKFEEAVNDRGTMGASANLLSTYIPTRSAVLSKGDINSAPVPGNSYFTDFRCNSTSKVHMAFDTDSINWLLEKFNNVALLPTESVPIFLYGGLDIRTTLTKDTALYYYSPDMKTPEYWEVSGVAFYAFLNGDQPNTVPVYTYYVNAADNWPGQEGTRIYYYSTTANFPGASGGETAFYAYKEAQANTAPVYEYTLAGNDRNQTVVYYYTFDESVSGWTKSQSVAFHAIKPLHQR